MGEQMVKASTKISSDPRALLLCILDEAYDRTAWHGPNLRGSVRQVSAEQAVWRPRPGRHSIAEITVHCAYWKYAVRRRILGGKRGSFPLKGSNWFALPEEITNQQWRDYVKLLDGEHKALREAMVTAPLSQLSSGRGSRREPAKHVYGIALHDTYHAGQIRTLKVLYKQATVMRAKARR
ncbi:MAG: DinB family protein [Planctomycetes bacterium]|nr:DinB family protein [Planctomycetota bacterium]